MSATSNAEAPRLTTIEAEVARYLRTGDSNQWLSVWSGVGFSQGTTCFVSMNYFETDEPLADFVVHEGAHVFHNCKRETIGLPATRRSEWLLEIAFGKRETFAYACEAYSRLLELGESHSSRQALLDAHTADLKPPDGRVDGDEYLAILRAALSARNGWKTILKACAPGHAQ